MYITDGKYLKYFTTITELPKHILFQKNCMNQRNVIITLKKLIFFSLKMK